MKTFLNNRLSIPILKPALLTVILVTMIALLTYLAYGLVLALTVLGILAGILYFVTIVGIAIHKYINE